MNNLLLLKSISNFLNQRLKEREKGCGIILILYI